MRTLPGIQLAAFKDSRERAEIKKLYDNGRQVTGALARSLLPGQAPAANPVSSSPSPGGTSFPAPGNGDMLRGFGSVWTLLPVGANGTILSVSGGSPEWLSALSLLPVHDHSGALQGGSLLGATVSFVSNTATAGAAFQDAGAPTKKLRVVLSGAVGDNAIVVATTAARQWTLQDFTGTLYQTGGADVAVGDGGTGVSSLTSNAVLLGGATVGSVGPGASNTVLRGTGGAPTFGTIDAGYIDNRTRKCFIPAAAFETATKVNLGSAGTSAQTINFPDSTTTTVSTWFMVPSDRTSGGAYTILFSQSGTSTDNMFWRIDTLGLTVGSTLVTAAVETSSDLIITLTGTANQSNEAGSGGGSYAANTYVRLVISRLGGDGFDTSSDTGQFHGVMFEYTADM